MRKVRKYRRTLKRKKGPKLDILDREKSFNQSYKENVSVISSDIKRKPSKIKADKTSKAKSNTKGNNKNASGSKIGSKNPGNINNKNSHESNNAFPKNNKNNLYDKSPSKKSRKAREKGYKINNKINKKRN